MSRESTEYEIGLPVSRALLYEAFYLKAHEIPSILEFHKFAQKHYQIPASPRVLDLGCGTGRMLMPFFSQGWQVTGFEPDTDYFLHARQKHAAEDRVTIENRGFLDLDAKEEFNLVTSINGPFYYLIHEKERARALRSIYQALKPGGVAILDVANFLYLLKNYDSSRSVGEERSLEGYKILKTFRHTFDYQRALWEHHEHYEFEMISGKGTTITHQETYRFAILSVPYLLELFRTSGFAKIDTYSSWNSRAPHDITESRIIICAQK